MDTIEVMNEILTNALGISYRDLDSGTAADMLLYSVTMEYARHRAQAQHYAARAAAEYQRIADTPTATQVYQVSSDAQKYNEAVVAMQALNAPLGAAIAAYKHAHEPAEQPAA